MSEKLSLQEERELIYLLLHKKEAISIFFDSGLIPDQFNEEHRPVIHAISEAYDNHNVLLTRKTFKEQLKL